jgi:hypothetical protein
MTKRTDSGLPRRTPGRALDDETQPQPHPHGDAKHIHRMGQLPHDHDDDGRPVFAADAKFKPAATDQHFGMITDGDYRPVPEGLGFVPPPDEAEAADPPAAPSESGDALEPSGVASAGSGGGSGRPSPKASLTRDGIVAPDVKVSEVDPPKYRTREIGRPDAGESVIAALGGVYNPAAEPGYAIRLATDFERLIVMGQHYARLVQANADKQPPAAKDVREVYRKLRQIAATHGIDLDDTGGGS